MIRGGENSFSHERAHNARRSIPPSLFRGDARSRQDPRCVAVLSELITSHISLSCCAFSDSAVHENPRTAWLPVTGLSREHQARVRKILPHIFRFLRTGLQSLVRTGVPTQMGARACSVPWACGVRLYDKCKTKKGVAASCPKILAMKHNAQRFVKCS